MSPIRVLPALRPNCGKLHAMHPCSRTQRRRSSSALVGHGWSEQAVNKSRFCRTLDPEPYHRLFLSVVVASL
eukprot:2289972-Rhodomonas_salina.1